MEPLTILLTIVAASLIIYQFFIRGLSHFEKIGVQYETPLPIIGNMGPYVFRRTSLMEYLQKLYYKYSDLKYFGFYSFKSPIIVLRDPELISSITVKNFDYFCDHRGFVDEEFEPLMGKNLFSLRGDHWREVRKVLSPAFTSSKMKMMFKLICQCGENVANSVHQQARGGKVIDAKDIFTKYTNDVVASCAFGINLDTMKNPTNEFYTLGRKAVNFDSILSVKFFIGQNFPRLLKYLGVKLFSERVTRFFTSLVEDTVRTRMEQGIFRPDMIQLMMESSEKGTDVSTGDMTSQAFVFFIAGFDSSATIAGFLAHEIAVNPEVQKKLREEIEKVMKETDGNPTYEAVNQMKYFDAVVNETLRLYPLTNYLDRVCVKEFELPAAAPGCKPVTLKPGSTVWILPFSLHRDPKYFPDPDKFVPERFLNGNVNTSVYMPFGIGPRICIGNRFALMELKVLMFYLLLRCEISPCSKTAIPMVFNKKSFITLPERGFWFKFRARDSSDDANSHRISTKE